MQDIERWLEHNGLVEYSEAFLAQRIELADLPDLTDEDLRELGLPMGPRKRLLRAAAALRDAPLLNSEREALDVAGSSPGEAERRQLTIMFCDLVGSVALGEQLDLEDYRELLARVRSAVVSATNHYDGFVARHQGDGVLAYFGYPQAHENDAERAVRAGLEIVASVAGLAPAAGDPLAMRVGIATGPAVVGDVLATSTSDELAALGSAPNLAARLQARAEPGSVLVSETTARLTAGLFETAPEESLALKGFEAPVTAYRVAGVAEAQTPSQATGGASLSPLVGRSSEIELVLGRWEQARTACAQSVQICAEPGVGKSRVIHEVRTRLRATRHRVIGLFCSPYHTDVALFPVAQSLERAVRTVPDAPSGSKVAALGSWIAALSLPPDDFIPYLAPLLALAPTDRVESPELAPDVRRRRTLDALVRILEAASDRDPLLLIAEDLHWCDPTTLELLGLVHERLPDAALLALLTYRPEFSPPWRGVPNLTTLSLNHLTLDECRALARGVAREHHLSDDLVEEIVTKTDGVPLFVEELSAAIVESAADGLPVEGVPATLRDALTARLDRLGDAKHVAQIASVIGRQFEFELLAAACEDPDALATALERLEAAGLIARRGGAELTGAVFRFKHALVRESAYESLLHSRRRTVHERVALALERTASAAQEQPELLAHHHASAGNLDRAAAYRLQAGSRAARSNALAEAEASFQAGLALLDPLPDSAERLASRAELLLGLGSVQMVLHGFASAQARETYSIARRVSSRGDHPARRFYATWGLWLNRHVGGDLDAARELLSEVNAHASGAGGRDARLQAHHASWTTLLALGEVARAFEHTERGVALYREDEHRDHAFRYGGHDPGVCGGAHAGVAGWLLGEPAQALARWQAGMALGRRLDHKPSIGVAAAFGAYMFLLRREPERIVELSDADLTMPAHLRAGTQVLRGWALAALGERDLGPRECSDGIEAYVDAGARIHLGFLCYVMSQTLQLVGRPDDALAWLDRAASADGVPGNAAWWRPELIRSRAVLRVAVGDAEPLALISGARAAVEAARQIGSKALELRAAVTLGEALREAGEHGEARAALAPLLSGDQEAGGEVDVIAARRVLDSLR